MEHNVVQNFTHALSNAILSMLGIDIHSEFNLSLLTCCFCYILHHDTVQGELFSIDELKESQLDVFKTHEGGTIEDDNEHKKQTNSTHELSSDSDIEKPKRKYDAFASEDLNELRGFNYLSESEELCSEDKKFCPVNIDGENEAAVAGNISLHIEEASKSEVVIVFSSDSDSDADANVNARYN